MKIYTRTGDSGTTGLYGGTRVRKDALRVEAYGTLDELNAVLGLAVSLLQDAQQELAACLQELQAQLFALGAELAVAPERSSGKAAQRLRLMSSAQVTALEEAIDALEARLEPLTAFILPGGAPAASALHLARATARRAERLVVALNAQEVVNPEILRYLNRLSDYLFVLARTANRLTGTVEQRWPGASAG